MNVVIYARYSSHNQQETSIEGQLKVCHEFCERNNYTVIHEYIDRAISGRTDNRPDFLQMIQDSANRNFEFVIVYQLDRFSRNRYDSAHYKNRLKKNGVRVLSARENINEDASGILMESVLEGMAEYYSAELSQKVKRGMEINASKCLCTGGNRTLGFYIDKDKKFQIDPNTSPIIKLIFEMYADGKSIVEITDYLNAQGYKTIQNKPFGKNSIRNILGNKRYIGTYTYKDTEIAGGIPRIISDELFNKVQEVLKKNKKAPARARAKEEYLLMLLFAQNEKSFRIKYKKCVFVKMYNVAKKYPRRKSKSAWVFSFFIHFSVSICFYNKIFTCFFNLIWLIFEQF